MRYVIKQRWILWVATALALATGASVWFSVWIHGEPAPSSRAPSYPASVPDNPKPEAKTTDAPAPWGVEVGLPVDGKAPYVVPVLLRKAPDGAFAIDAVVSGSEFVRLATVAASDSSSFNIFHGNLYVLSKDSRRLSRYRTADGEFELQELVDGQTWGPEGGLLMDLYETDGGAMFLACVFDQVYVRDCRLYAYEASMRQVRPISAALPIDDLYEQAVIHEIDANRGLVRVRTLGGEAGVAWGREFEVDVKSGAVKRVASYETRWDCGPSSDDKRKCSEEEVRATNDFEAWRAEFLERYGMGGHRAVCGGLVVPELPEEGAGTLGCLRVNNQKGVRTMEDEIVGIRYEYPAAWGEIGIGSGKEQIYYSASRLSGQFLVASDPTVPLTPRGAWFGDYGHGLTDEASVRAACDGEDGGVCRSYRNRHGILVTRALGVVFGFDVCGESCVSVPRYYIHHPGVAYQGIVLSPVRFGVHQFDNRVVEDFDALVDSLEFIR